MPSAQTREISVYARKRSEAGRSFFRLLWKDSRSSFFAVSPSMTGKSVIYIPLWPVQNVCHWHTAFAGEFCDIANSKEFPISQDKSPAVFRTTAGLLFPYFSMIPIISLRALLSLPHIPAFQVTRTCSSYSSLHPAD